MTVERHPNARGLHPRTILGMKMEKSENYRSVMVVSVDKEGRADCSWCTYRGHGGDLDVMATVAQATALVHGAAMV